MKWKIFERTQIGEVIEADQIKIDHGVLLFLKDITSGKQEIIVAYKIWSHVIKEES